ncbi:Hypothetical protein SMAX5B_005257 [Scophthalmus maximus]|uniref:Uncharacterized protein n=1 Tax=Scophthalmus maximus TaxID=52904 RepID=A0A2U9CGR8_SCOMX|nr:Hypothetical protein SMAX5B_005257 [Scophthalmus maximus]
MGLGNAFRLGPGQDSYSRPAPHWPREPSVPWEEEAAAAVEEAFNRKKLRYADLEGQVCPMEADSVFPKP